MKFVKNIDDWNEIIIFNLLYFFRNFIVYRFFIVCFINDGYLMINLKIKEFRFKFSNDENFFELWIFIGRGFWILVLELSYVS